MSKKKRVKVHKITAIGAQGDVLFRRIDKLPGDVTEQARAAGAPLVVAHSETGHHHAIHSAEAKLFERLNDPFRCYLQLASDVDVVHHRDFDTHATIRLGVPPGGGVYEVIRQREHTPEGLRRVED